MGKLFQKPEITPSPALSIKEAHIRRSILPAESMITAYPPQSYLENDFDKRKEIRLGRDLNPGQKLRRLLGCPLPYRGTM